MATYRRYYIDYFLTNTPFAGKVLDIGGKKINKRGAFRPPLEGLEAWEYLNTDGTTQPDYKCSAEKIPVDDNTFDMVLMAEVMEHLPEPGCVLKECSRILRTDGKVIATVPLFYPIHGDPEDYQRWTPEKTRLEFEQAGFTVDRLEPMGSVVAVICDLIYVSLGAASKTPNALLNKIFRKLIMSVGRKFFLWLDEVYAYKSVKITTGYYVVARNSP